MTTVPRRLFDAHLHIIDPRFPLIPNQGFVPGAFTVEDYRARTADLRVEGGAVVSGSFQGVDRSYLLDALAALGPGFVGVARLPPTVTEEEILRLHAHGVRAVRFDLFRGGSVEGLARVARRVHGLAGWHVELYLDSADLPDLETVLAGLPRVVIDHLGMTPDGYPALLRLVESGVRVKASGFGRVSLDPVAALREIVAIDPGAPMLGTDLPGTRARRPFVKDDLSLIVDAVGESLAGRVLHDNAAEWYRLDP